MTRNDNSLYDESKSAQPEKNSSRVIDKQILSLMDNVKQHHDTLAAIDRIISRLTGDVLPEMEKTKENSSSKVVGHLSMIQILTDDYSRLNNMTRSQLQQLETLI